MSIVIKITMIEEDGELYLDNKGVCPEYDEACQEFNVDTAMDCYMNTTWVEEGEEESCGCPGFCPMFNGMN